MAKYCSHSLMVGDVTHTDVRARTIVLDVGIYQEYIGMLVMCCGIT